MRSCASTSDSDRQNELAKHSIKVAETALGRDATVGKKLTMEDVDQLLATPVASPWDDV